MNNARRPLHKYCMHFVFIACAGVLSAGAHLRMLSEKALTYVVATVAVVDGLCSKMNEASHACAICTDYCHVSVQHARSCSRQSRDVESASPAIKLLPAS